MDRFTAAPTNLRASLPFISLVLGTSLFGFGIYIAIDRGVVLTLHQQQMDDQSHSSELPKLCNANAPPYPPPPLPQP